MLLSKLNILSQHNGMDNIKGTREAFLSPSGVKYLFCNTYRPHGGAYPLSAASNISNYDITDQSPPKRTSGTYSSARLQKKKNNLVTTMGCTNSGRQVARATKFRTVDPKICRSLFWCVEFWNDAHIFGKFLYSSLEHIFVFVSSEAPGKGGKQM